MEPREPVVTLAAVGPNGHDEPLDDGLGDGVGSDPEDRDEPMLGPPPDPLDRVWAHPEIGRAHV